MIGSARWDDLEASRLPTVYLEDMDSILPQVLVVRRKVDPRDYELAVITCVAIYDTLENALNGGCEGCIAEDFELSPLAELQIETAIKAQEEINRRTRKLDESLRDTLKSIMGGVL